MNTSPLNLQTSGVVPQHTSLQTVSPKYNQEPRIKHIVLWIRHLSSRVCSASPETDLAHCVVQARFSPRLPGCRIREPAAWRDAYAICERRCIPAASTLVGYAACYDVQYKSQVDFQSKVALRLIAEVQANVYPPYPQFRACNVI